MTSKSSSKRAKLDEGKAKVKGLKKPKDTGKSISRSHGAARKSK